MTLVTLNVGGSEYATSTATLCRCPTSMLARMFEGSLPPAERDSKGRHFIDRDGHAFQWILRYLRDEDTCLPESAEQCVILKKEAEYYQPEGLVSRLGEHSQLRHSGILAPVSVVSGFRGVFKKDRGSISLTSTAFNGEALQRKIAWARQSAPMAELNKAIEILLASFWGRACDRSGMSAIASCTFQRGMYDIHPRQLQGPSKLVFLAVKDDGNRRYLQQVGPPESAVIPDDLQDIVLEWFILFCFELSSLGYRVLHEIESPSTNTYSLSVAD